MKDYKKALFSMDCFDENQPDIEGITYGNTWNGWACPYFTFENALLAAGLPVRHIEQGRNVPMYRTTVPCQPAGKFSGPLVVSMRPMTPEQAIRATTQAGQPTLLFSEEQTIRATTQARQPALLFSEEQP